MFAKSCKEKSNNRSPGGAGVSQRAGARLFTVMGEELGEIINCHFPFPGILMNLFSLLVSNLAPFTVSLEQRQFIFVELGVEPMAFAT